MVFIEIPSVAFMAEVFREALFHDFLESPFTDGFHEVGHVEIFLRLDCLANSNARYGLTSLVW